MSENPIKDVVTARPKPLDGVIVEGPVMEPVYSSFLGRMTHVLDRNALNPLRTALTLIAALRKLYPDKFKWRQGGKPFWLDLLVGNHVVREMLSEGGTAEVMASWQDDVVWFGATYSKYFL